LIAGSEGFERTGAFDSMETAAAPMGLEPRPGVALIDIQLPGIDGIEGICRVRALWPEICPVMLAVYDDDECIVGSTAAGANRYSA